MTLKSLTSHRHTLVALIGGLLAWTQVSYVPDGSINRDEWYGLAVTLATALGVYGVSAYSQPSSQVVDAPVADAYPEPLPAEPVAEPAADAVL